MLVTPTASAVTHVDGAPMSLVVGQEVDLPDALAKQLTKAGLVRAVVQTKRQAAAPENK